jgi:hypothetical protein
MAMLLQEVGLAEFGLAGRSRRSEVGGGGKVTRDRGGGGDER